MTMIVILDGYVINPGDMDWRPILELGHCKIYDRSKAEEIVSRAKDAEIVLIKKVKLSRQIIEALPKLKYIGILATGYDNVDLKAAKERNIVVTSIPQYCTLPTAQQALALLLEITRQVGHYTEEARKSQWSKSLDYCYWNLPVIDLNGLTMGILGFGYIGKMMAQYALTLGMEVLVNTKTLPEIKPEKIEFVTLDVLFAKSDVLSLHCSLTEKTKNIVNKEMLSKMKKNAILINTSRGPVIDEVALADALNNERIFAAGLDVLSEEPPSPNHPLLTAKNCFITPHISCSSYKTRELVIKEAANNIKGFLTGKLINVIVKKGFSL